MNSFIGFVELFALLAVAKVVSRGLMAHIFAVFMVLMSHHVAVPIPALRRHSFLTYKSRCKTGVSI